jgi:hypothetical protein
MHVQSLVVDSVIRRQAGRVAVRVVQPEGVDLQFIYRAALSIYWNPAEGLLEDRCEAVDSAVASAARIARALREEYGMALNPSGTMRWEGFIDDEQDQVADVLFG